MADWVSSLLAGLGAGAESLGTSMTEREKRNAAAKQRAFELAMQQADKNAELGITDIAPRLPSEPALTKMSDTIGRIGALGKPQSMDMLSDQLGLRPAVGGQVQKFTTPSPDFSIGGPTPDMSDAATNYEVSRTGALTFGPRPTSPRFDNFTDQTVVPAATPATGGGANASIAKMLQPDMAPPAPKTTAPVSAAEQDLIDYGKQVQANPKARQTLASVMKGKTPEEQAVFMADRLTAGKLPAARQVEFDKLKAMGPKAYLNDVDIRMTPDMGPPLSMAGSDTPPAAPPSTPFAAPMAAEAGPRTVSALGAPTMPRTRLGSIPDVQSQFGNVPGFTGVTPENASYVMQYDPLHPEAGPIRKRIDYKQGTDYLAMQAQTKANEEREQVKQDAEGRRLATALALKNADTLREQQVAKENASRANYEYIKAVDPTNISVQGRWEDLTPGQQGSLQRVADTVSNRDKIRTTAKYRPAPTAKQLAQQNVYKKESTTLDNAKDAIATYRQQLKDVGVELWPTKGKVLLSGAYNNVMLQAKEIAKLGVLNGPDMGIIEGIVGNPTSAKSGLLNFMGTRSNNLMAGLDQYDQMIDRMRSRLDANYLNAPEPQNNNNNFPPGFEFPPSNQPEGDQ